MKTINNVFTTLILECERLNIPYFHNDRVLYINSAWEQLIKKIPNKSVSLLLTDPPYGITEMEYDQKTVNFNFLLNEWLRVKKDKHSPALFFAAHPFNYRLMKTRWDKFYYYEWYWIKNRPSGFLTAYLMPLKSVELIIVFSEKVAYYDVLKQVFEARSNKQITNKKSDKCVYGLRWKKHKLKKTIGYPKNILFEKVDQKAKKLHPHAKPPELLKFLIKRHCPENGLIIDVFAGIGTTLAAATNTNRYAIGFEVDAGFFRNGLEYLNS